MDNVIHELKIRTLVIIAVLKQLATPTEKEKKSILDHHDVKTIL